MSRASALVVLFALVLLTGCATTKMDPNRLDAFHDAAPQSILIVPVVSNVTDVQAPTSVLATLPFVLGEKGYYVFPVNTVKTLLEYEGYYEPAEVHAAPPENLANLFKADAILYVTIYEWTAKYLVLSTTTEVDFGYRIVNADGAELWRERKQLQYTPDSGNSGGGLIGLIAMAITAAIERAAPNYLPLTRQANGQVFNGPASGIPPGPYSIGYEQYYQGIKAQ